MNSSDSSIPRVPIGEWGDAALTWLRETFGILFELFSDIMGTFVETLTDGLVSVPALLMIAILALIAWIFRSWQLALFSAVLFLLSLSMEQWETTMQTMALVIVSTLVAVIIAIPVGILASQSSVVSAIVRPIMDFMQTMPAFVYLIPAVLFFSIGVVPGLFSTIIFAMPPAVRMTELGIRQVDSETVEAGHAFGASRGQILSGIQLPLAIPTIMAGVNQVIMLALSMAVIAGMVGADGLGKEVVDAIATMDLGKGIEAGLATVFLAIFLDRITAALGSPRDYPYSAMGLITKAREKRKRGLAA